MTEKTLSFMLLNCDSNPPDVITAANSLRYQAHGFVAFLPQSNEKKEKQK